jgi:hypothetical protein
VILDDEPEPRRWHLVVLLVVLLVGVLVAGLVWLQ